MTPKELLYVEDALGHVKFISDKCDKAKTEVTDPELVKLIDKVGKSNKKILTNFVNLLVSQQGGSN